MDPSPTKVPAMSLHLAHCNTHSFILPGCLQTLMTRHAKLVSRLFMNAAIIDIRHSEAALVAAGGKPAAAAALWVHRGMVLAAPVRVLTGTGTGCLRTRFSGGPDLQTRQCAALRIPPVPSTPHDPSGA
jgi:hypothetical protein